MSSRRDVLKRFFGVPWFAALNLQPQANDPRRLHRRLGIQVLRFLNTAQHWHKESAGLHIGYRALFGTAAVAAMRTDSKTVTAGIAASFVDALTPTNPNGDIAPGWRLHFELTESGAGYRAFLEDRSGSGAGDLLTDHTGLIRDSNPVAVVQQASASGRVGGRAMRYLASLTGAGATANMPPACDPWSPPELYCAFFGGCCECLNDNCCVECFNICCQVYSGSCVNCGCQWCIWSCSTLCYE